MSLSLYLTMSALLYVHVSHFEVLYVTVSKTFHVKVSHFVVAVHRFAFMFFTICSWVLYAWLCRPRFNFIYHIL